jgi:LysR family transcriptional regulator, glycine cleavage system transcriptional activator
MGAMGEGPPVRGHLPDPGLSWSQLRAFEACARLSDFAEAAAELNLTASAIRQQVTLLERRLGVTLFERRAGRLALTPVGAGFEHDISRPMRDLIRACTVASQASAAALITLTAPPLFARRFLYRDHFLEWCNRNAIVLDITDVKRDMFAPGSLAAIRLGTSPDAKLKPVPLVTVELVLAAAPKIAEQARPKDPAWWSEQILLVPEVSKPAWTVLLRDHQLTDSQVRGWLNFSSYTAALDAACIGRGLFLAPLRLVDPEFTSGRLLQLADVTLPGRAGYSLLMKRDFANTTRGRLLRRKILAEIALAR